MRLLKLSLPIALFLFVFGCAKEVATPETQSPLAQEALEKAEARLTEAQEALENEDIETRGNTVILEDGSTDGLAAAIAEAGYNGTVIVESGDHWESGTVEITHRVTIQGEPGATLYVDVSGPGFQHDPALYIRNANNVRITNLTIRPQSGPGNTGILVKDGPRAHFQNNSIIGFGFAIWLAGADNAVVLNNYLEGFSNSTGWGLVSMAGVNVFIFSNEVTNFWAGIFTSHRKGLAVANETYGNNAGIFLCTAQFSSLPDGTPIMAPEPSNDWVIYNNYSHNNVAGYRAMDGAFENLIVRNRSANNSQYDIQLRGEVDGGNIIFPTSHDNKVISLGDLSSLLIKNCGDNNTVIGGTLVDTSIDPCP